MLIKRTLQKINRFRWNIFKVLSISRISNSIYSLVERFSLKAVARAHPMAFMIEPANKCNLRCPMCPAVIENKIGIRPDMTLELFNTIVEKVSPYAFYLAMWNYGEPLINQNIEKMIKSASKKKFIVEMHSNGQLLNLFTKNVFDQELANIPDCLPDEMSISVDSINEATYRYYRKGGELAVLKDNIRAFILKRNQMKITKPWVVIQFILMKNNAEEIINTQAIKEFADELQVDDYNIKYFSYRGDNIEEYLPTKKNLRLMLPKASRKIKPCLRPWSSTVILSDGTVIPCCYDYSNEWPMGNITEKPFEEIWNDLPYQEFRSMLLAGNEPRICINCPGRNFMSLFKK